MRRNASYDALRPYEVRTGPEFSEGAGYVNDFKAFTAGRAESGAADPRQFTVPLTANPFQNYRTRSGKRLTRSAAACFRAPFSCAVAEGMLRRTGAAAGKGTAMGSHGKHR